MRLTALGKIVIVILALGIAAGGWRMWQQSSAGGKNGKGGFSFPKINLPKINMPGGSNGGGSGGGKSQDADNEIRFVVTAAKKDWVTDQIKAFNKESGGKWKIIAEPLPSREAMHAILGGKVKPVLWSPGAPIWPARLAEAWQQKHGSTIVDLNDNNGYRVYLRSPLVFLTTREKAKFLRPRLGGSQPWLELRKLSLRPTSTPWGSFRFSHADPLTSSSGMLTLGLILYDYGLRTGQTASLEAVAKDKKFMAYLKELERSLVYDRPAEEGTTKLTNAFLEDTRRYDLITAYESAALDAAAKNPDIAVIYPTPTAVSQHAVSLLNADWVTDAQREGAIAFMNFLGKREALQDGIGYSFRPAQAAGDVSLAGKLSSHAAQGFQQSYSSIELPTYEALNTAAYQWRVYIARKPPT